MLHNMKLLECIIICVCCVGCNCQWSEYTKVPTFANMMCPADQIKFQKVTCSVVDCVQNCIAAPGCTSLIYLHVNKTCFGIKSYNPFIESSPLTGAVFYMSKKAAPGCISLIYLHENKTCFGIKSNNPFNESSPLPGAVFYKPKIVAPGTPMVEGLSDSQFTASSVWISPYYEPWQARFSSTKCWIPDIYDTNQWLQVDFVQQILATHVATKGYFDWVKSYKVLYSTDCISFSTIKNDIGNDKVFPGNTDTYTYEHDALDQPVMAHEIGPNLRFCCSRKKCCSSSCI